MTLDAARVAMTEMRSLIAVVSDDVRAVFHERPHLYKAIVQIDAIALEWLRAGGEPAGKRSEP